MKPVRAVKVTLENVINSESIDSMFSEFVTPKKATTLAFNGGTLVEVEDGKLFLVPMGDWFRSDFINRNLPQVSEFNKLQDYGLTVIKDKIVRNEESLGQEISSKNSVRAKKVNKAVASDSSEQEES
jgi:hypothetical protein